MRWTLDRRGTERHLDFDVLDDLEREIIGRCLSAAARGPFFPDWELSVLFGLDRSELRAIVDAWPSMRDSEMASLAVNNSVVNLLGYPGDEDWDEWIGVPRERVGGILLKLQESPSA